MQLTPNSFFDGKFQEINLNTFFSFHGISDTKHPELFQEALNKIGLLTYGGYGENRETMFKGSYLSKTRNFFHLGIDINVPAGRHVMCPFDCEVIDSFVDKDTDIGWGGRLIIRRNNCDESTPLLVLAHLDPDSMARKYQRFICGQMLGQVGTWPTNGNTFEHLHIQCLLHECFDDFDGYGTLEDLEDYPNPLEVEF